MSSDSEDDFYDNFTERLQQEKDKFQEDKTEIENLLDDTAELDEIVKNNKLPPKKKSKATKSCSEEAASSSVCNLPEVSVENTTGQSSTRVTRSRAKKKKTEDEPDLEPPPSRSKRKKAAPEPSNSDNSDNNSPNTPSTSRGRGRARGRGRKGASRGRKSTGTARQSRAEIMADFLRAMLSPAHNNLWTAHGVSSNDARRPSEDLGSIPTYSIGNTAEYPDELHNQPLFSNSNKKKEETVVEEILDEENEELSVKVYWLNTEFFKFTIRRHQNLSQIFNYFANKENSSQDKILLTYNEKILKPDDTPDSIQYSIVKFIDAGVITQGLKRTDSENIEGGIRLKFQCQNMKKPFEITVRPDDKMTSAMIRCAEHMEKPLEKLKFEFDGDSISGKSTANELEFEGGECIDVKILS